MRGEETASSDVDLLIELPRPIGLLPFAGLKLELEDALHRKVDLVEYEESINRISAYLKDIDCSTFAKSPAIQDAVIRRLEITGEAAKRVPDHIKLHYPKIPWRSMAAMRDVLIHDYPEIVIDQVWITATEHLPPLRPQLETVLADLEAAARDQYQVG